jgi:hypothetical protein
MVPLPAALHQAPTQRPGLCILPAVDYAARMFAIRRCTEPGCRRGTPNGRLKCTLHDPEAVQVSGEAARALLARDNHSDLSLAGLAFDNLNLRGRRMVGSDFSRCTLVDVDLSECTLRYVFFDNATLTRCIFRGANLWMCVFGGATLSECDFTGSDVVQTSFVGANLRATRFDDSDLYSSRFVTARLELVSMRNCNLKEVHFDRPASPAAARGEILAQLGVEASESNPGEAVFGGER